MGASVGIDLGTTNSALAIRQLTTTIAVNKEGDELTPSCVAAPENTTDRENLLVGKTARDLLQQNPEHTVTSIKRLMGHDYDDPEVQKLINEATYSYQILRDTDDEQGIRIPLRNFMVNPEEISAAILRKVVKDAASSLSQEMTQAVVTVPAYFSDRQKYATRRACELAGIKLLRLLPEPTAAALAFGIDEFSQGQMQVVLVLDIGGGTFDVSLLNVADGQFMEVTKGGDMWLGGDDIDSLLIEWAYERIAQNEGCGAVTELVAALSPGERAMFLAQMRSEAEQAKIQVSNGASSASLQVFGRLKDKSGRTVDVDLDIDRSEFDSLINPVISKIMKITNNLLAEVGYDTTLVDSVLMVGGSAQIPAIQEALQQRFGQEKVRVHPRPMFAVVEGAALMAHRLGSGALESGPLNLMHTTAHEYYLQLAGAKKHLLVERNTPLPVTVEERLRFSNKDQVLARLRVFNQVDGVMESVGELWFHRFANGPNWHEELFRDPPIIKLKFTINEDNIIEMTAASEERPDLEIKAEITRGNSALKMYQDLDRCLADVAVSSPTESEKLDSFILSKKILDTISYCDDLSSQSSKPQLRQLAAEQMVTVKQLATKEECLPALVFEHLLNLSNDLASSLSSDEARKQVETMKNELQSLLENLTDPDGIASLVERYDDFIEDEELAETILFARWDSFSIEVISKSDAKKVRQFCQDALKANAEEREQDVEVALSGIRSILDGYESLHSSRNQRFDRDVERLPS